MKTLIAVAVLLFSVVVVQAEQPNNPDRFPSIGINLYGGSISGETTYSSNGATAKHTGEASEGAFSIDGIWPVSNHISLNAAYQSISRESEEPETAIFSGSKTELKGGAFRIGIRFYIH